MPVRIIIWREGYRELDFVFATSYGRSGTIFFEVSSFPFQYGNGLGLVENQFYGAQAPTYISYISYDLGAAAWAFPLEMILRLVQCLFNRNWAVVRP